MYGIVKEAGFRDSQTLPEEATVVRCSKDPSCILDAQDVYVRRAVPLYIPVLKANYFHFPQAPRRRIPALLRRRQRGDTGLEGGRNGGGLRQLPPLPAGAHVSMRGHRKSRKEGGGTKIVTEWGGKKVASGRRTTS